MSRRGSLFHHKGTFWLILWYNFNTVEHQVICTITTVCNQSQCCIHSLHQVYKSLFHLQVVTACLINFSRGATFESLWCSLGHISTWALAFSVVFHLNKKWQMIAGVWLMQQSIVHKSCRESAAIFPTEICKRSYKNVEEFTS